MGIAVFAGMLGVTALRSLPDAGVLRSSIGRLCAARGSPVGDAAQRAARSRRRRVTDMRTHRLVTFVLALCAGGLRGCGAPYAAPDARAGGAGQRRSGARRRAALRSALVAQFEDPVLDALVRPRARRPITTCGSPWPASIRRARSSTSPAAIAIPTRHGRRVGRRREQAIPGFSDEPPRVNTYRAGLRRVLGARPVRPRPIGDSRGRGRRPRASRRRSTTCA